MTTQTSEDRIALYRARAGEARSKADRFTEAEYRKVLLEVAATWERLADLEGKIPSLPPS
jgi:hypothetical protein